ncbi:hypothetical protein [Planktothricoides sp. SR001]|uniref:hypothetical protein n=1 Tax=Planktothricoides sp. SR001 TaxID=1705388 RepID=UPI0012E1D9A9|nr:hypothetical protein [Planktothricoides sp. SR001]
MPWKDVFPSAASPESSSAGDRIRAKCSHKCSHNRLRAGLSWQNTTVVNSNADVLAVAAKKWHIYMVAFDESRLMPISSETLGLKPRPFRAALI